MRFSFENSDIDYGYTLVDNIFIEDFLPYANAAYVKVYLYCLKRLSNGEETSLDIISSNLRISTSEVVDALNYLKNEGLIKINETLDDGYDIEFINLKNLYSKNTSKPAESSSGMMFSAMENKNVRRMFNNIDYIMRRQTTPTEKIEILNFISEYNMDTDMIEVIFDYAVSKKNKVSVNYVGAIVRSFYDRGVTTLDEVNDELRKTDEIYVRKNNILRKLGLKFRLVSDEEVDMINSWYEVYNFNDDIIDLALEKTAVIKNPSIKYANSILKNWSDIGVKDISDISKLDRKSISRPKKSKFQNFTPKESNMSDDDLNRLLTKNIKKDGYNGE